MVQRHYRAHRARKAALAMGDRERVRSLRAVRRRSKFSTAWRLFSGLLTNARCAEYCKALIMMTWVSTSSCAWP